MVFSVNLEQLLIFIPFILLTVCFFVFREYTVRYYGRLLIISNSKRFRNRKEKLNRRVRNNLQIVKKGKSTKISKLIKEANLLQLGISYLDEEIRKIEEEYEFHKSLKLNIITQPIWVFFIAKLAPNFFNF